MVNGRLAVVAALALTTLFVPVDADAQPAKVQAAAHAAIRVFRCRFIGSRSRPLMQPCHLTRGHASSAPARGT